MSIVSADFAEKLLFMVVLILAKERCKFTRIFSLMALLGFVEEKRTMSWAVVDLED